MYMYTISLSLSFSLFLSHAHTHIHQHEAAKVMQDAINEFRGTPEEVRLDTTTNSHCYGVKVHYDNTHMHKQTHTLESQ